MNKVFFYLIMVINGILITSCTGEKAYKVYTEKSDTLQKQYLLERLQNQFDKREEDFNESLGSEKEIFNRIDKLKNWYNEKVGELPQKSNLNSITTKVEEFPEFTIEWIAFESRPNHHVTGLFYLPKKGSAPYPAVYIPCGHSVYGKGSEAYQKAARLFVMNGFAVLQADPICQGERMQYLDEHGNKITEERMLMHEILGQKLLLTGSNTLIYELWDNIRGIDFLEQHPKVDKNRIATAGNSGGGTQVTYLVAFDDRIKVATPSCYIATTEKKFNTIGSQDGCQQLWGEGKIGIEEHDFLMLAAPKPIRILSAEQDFFQKDGAIAAYNELKKVYKKLGVPEKIDQVFCNEKHGWHKPLREASVQWCKKWLLNDDDIVVEPDSIGFYSDSTLWVTSTGKVLTYFDNEKSVSDLTREALVKCKENRDKFLKSNNKEIIIVKAKELIGFEEIDDMIEFKKIDNIKEGNFSTEMFQIKREKQYDFYLPAVLYNSDRLNDESKIFIVVSEFGKSNELNNNKFVQNEIAKGNLILAIDVTNTGEIEDVQKPHYDNKEFWIGKLPIYEGKTLLTYRTEDILIAIRFLEVYFKKDFNDVNLISNGITGFAAIHAALFDSSIKSLYVSNSKRSWEEIAAADYIQNQIGNIVPGVLNFYDIPDLIELNSKVKTIFID